MDVFADAEHFRGAPFEQFGDEHLLALTLVVLWQVLLLSRFRAADPATRRTMRGALTGALWAQEAGYHLWRAVTGTWTPREMLPLHLCSAAIWVGGVMLLTRSYALYEFCYFGAIVGASLALLTPDLGPFGAPHYRFFQFFESHGLILTAPLWMTFVEGFRPSVGSLARASAGTAAYGLLVFAANRRLGSNYMFLNGKPPMRTPLDALPPWPRYLPIMGAGVAGLFALLFAPWALADAQGVRGAAFRPGPSPVNRERKK